MKKFDYIIGNPAYQDDNSKNTRKPPVYHKFMSAAYELGNVVELITPGRFLFMAGQTPDSWNQSMCNDEHLKVLMYEADASNIFGNVEIKGGVVITIHDSTRRFGKIGIFTPFPEVKSLLQKVLSRHSDPFMDSLVAPQGLYRFTQNAMKQYPEIEKTAGEGTKSKIVSSILPRLPHIFHTAQRYEKSNGQISLLGYTSKTRAWYNIDRSLLEENPYIDTYNVFIPESNGNGAFEPFSSPLVGSIGEGTADTFLSIGTFSSKDHAHNLLAYIKTRFLRTLLGVRKITQHNPAKTWCFVPVQNFTSNSDIDWSQSIADIDQQLYKKYGLSDKEVDFIETHVKEMA